MRGACCLVFDSIDSSRGGSFVFCFFFLVFLCVFVCVLRWGIGYLWVPEGRARGLEDKTAASQAVSNAVREDVRENKACVSADTG